MTRRKTSAEPAMPASVQKRRCAVYTRKSTDEGLEKEFNTLDAQREACEAYIASQAAYRVSDLKQLPITLPPLPEQQRIVDILDRAAAIQRLRWAAEEKARELIPALFVDMFGDPATNPKRWPVGSIGDVLDRIETGKNVMAGSGKSRYRILKVSAVTSGVYQEMESKPAPDSFEPDARSVVKPGDFLFSRANTAELVGATTIVDETDGFTLLPDKLWRLVWKAGVDTTYMLGVLQNTSIRAAITREASGTSASMRNVSQSKLLSIKFPVAPIEMQKVYCERLQAMMGAKALSLSASRFAHSIQQAVTSSTFSSAEAITR
jgi:type I restriction enzyme S subunit